MKRKIVAALVAFVTALGLGLVVATPAFATHPTACQSQWSGWITGGTDWGAFRYCWGFDYDTYEYWWQFEVDDTKTDGYAVHLEDCSDKLEGAFPATYPCSAYVGGYFDPQWGMGMVDLLNPPPPDLCIQSAGPPHMSQFPAIVTPAVEANPYHSWFWVLLVKGRCEGGAYQYIDGATPIQLQSTGQMQ